MQDEVEVAFCDLCGTSVPAADLASGAAVRHQGKTVGACCLGALRHQVAAAAAGGRIPAGEVRLLTVGVVLLVAIAAATMFVDHRLTGVDASVRAHREQFLQAQRADGEVLKTIGVAMDAMARGSDVDEVVRRVDEQAQALERLASAMQQQVDAVRQDVAALGRQQREQAAATIDYRPLLEDLRQRQVRLAEDVAGLRAGGAERAVPAPAVASPEPAAADPAAAPTLAPALAAAVRKLADPDPAARFEAVDELLRAKDAQVVPHLLPLAKDANSFVRRLTVEGLGEWKRADVVDALLVALGDGDPLVAETAWRSLKTVTGQKFPFEPGASRDAKARAVQRWQEWWDKSKATFGS